MTDLRARLADALLEHMVCECGEWAKDIGEHCHHLADVLLSLPGIAIVELPDTGTSVYFDEGWMKLNEPIDPSNPESLRRCGAALLVAANILDRSSL